MYRMTTIMHCYTASRTATLEARLVLALGTILFVGHTINPIVMPTSAVNGGVPLSDTQDEGTN